LINFEWGGVDSTTVVNNCRGYIGLIFIFTFLLFQNSGEAQIEAPVLKCIEADSLSWGTPNLSCGDLEGFVIYRSNEIDGPYEVLDTLTDITLTSYGAPNPFGQVWYYFMSSLADCPGEELLFSDTLSNLPLRSVPILSLSVEENGVLINWGKSSDPQISTYVVYKNTAAGTVPIDTVYNQLQYLDEDADGDNRSEIYYVLGMDDCGTKSFFDEPHNTILLNYEIVECEQRIDFDWNPYINWPEGISYHLLWVSDSPDGEFVVADSFSAETFSISFDQLIKGEEVCFYIGAVQTDLAVQSSSNTICLVPEIVEPVRDLIILNSCIDDASGGLTLDWYRNENAELESWEILAKSAGSSDYISLLKNDDPDLGVSLSQEDLNLPSALSMPLELVILTTDLCGKEVRSESTSSLQLELLEQTETANIIAWEWSPPELSGLILRELEKTYLDGSQEFISLVDGEINSFRDGISVTDANDGRICYVKSISGQLELPNGQNFSFTCSSNELCVSQEIKMYIPNAFRPGGGVNEIFKPAILFQESITEYRLHIFDRWGGLLFESANPNIGWDGTVDGENLNPGLYSYFIEIRSDRDETIRKSGALHLVR